MDIGQAIKKLRIERGMTQESLADSVGMSTNAISSWEIGKTIPPKTTIEKLCRAFGIPVSYMLMAAIEENMPVPEPDSIEDYSGQFKLRLPRSLHRQLALQSKREGVSMNQYCVFLLSQNNAARA